MNAELHHAAAAGDVVRLRAALAAGADVDARMGVRDVSKTPLGSVVAPGDKVSEDDRTACVRALLSAGASPSAPITRSPGDRWMPLHEAAFLGLYTVCRLLLDAGADVNVRQITNQKPCHPPLYYAVSESNHKVIALLISRGAVVSSDVEASIQKSPYLQNVRAAGSFANYEKQHRAKLVAMLAPKFVHLLPPELVSVVITFWAPVGLH